MRLGGSEHTAESELRFNHPSLKRALRELGVEFKDGPKEFVMQCFFDPDCASGKKSLYLNHLDSPGIYHCFKCNSKGFFDGFVRARTGWSEFRVQSFVRKHRAFDDPDDTIERAYTPSDVTNDYLKQFAFRHDYCYDRGLNEQTLRRYKIGYDKDENDIIIPWYDRVGKLVAIKRRKVLNKYYRFEMNDDISRLLFGLHFVRPHSIIWLCEGEFDAMYLDQCFRAGTLTGHGAVALGGKVLQPSARAELLMKAPKMVVLALDSDDDGREAAKNIGSYLAHDVPTYRLQYPQDCKDPNELPFEMVVKNAINAENECRALLDAHSARYEQWKGNNERT